MAVLSFIDIDHGRYFDNIKVTTFGAPRVGNKKWAAHFEKLTNHQSRRYLIKGDPIAILPECLTLFCNYRHTGIKIVCVKDTQICTQEKDTDDELLGRFTNAVDTVVNMDDEMRLGSIVDHIYNYPKIHPYTLVINGKVVSE